MVNFKVNFLIVTCSMGMFFPIYGQKSEFTHSKNERREVCPKICKCSMLEERTMADCR